MGVLKDFDDRHQDSALWQFVKFIFVSLLAMIVQFTLLNVLNHLPPIVDLFATDFEWWVFKSPVNMAEGAVVIGGLGYFISNNTANIVAQIVAFFVKDIFENEPVADFFI